MEKNIDICEELKQNFIDFAYEANSQRAFPDIRDGLKPGQRACLWEFYNKGYLSNKPHVKSAKVSGGVIASWWPHGDVAIYETFARMSQPWINNLSEVDWHGSNGNIVIGSTCASSRYTEARLSKSAEIGLFSNIKKKNVPMILNFSEDEEWPEVLPAIYPRLMVNGSQGIGVAVAQNWLPHNLKELTNIIVKFVNEGVLDYSNLAPDFPTGGTIINKDKLSTIYETGRGSVILRGKAEIEGNKILISDLPYQVYVEPFIEEVKKCIINETIPNISNIYNKTDKNRMLVEIECSKTPSIVLQQLYKNTNLQKSYNANFNGLVGKTPKLLNLKEYLNIYINHNIECIKKEIEFDLNKDKARLEIVQGLIKALESIDEIIKLIKESESSTKAKENLINKYNFTERQAKAIIDMKLGRLAKLESVELNKESEDLTSRIESNENILKSSEKQNEIFLNRLVKFTNDFGNGRKTSVTQITESKEEIEIETIPEEECIVVISKDKDKTKIKRIAKDKIKTQRRNTKGTKNSKDTVVNVIDTKTNDWLMIFTNKGKMYRLLVNDVPEGTKASKGENILNLIAFSDEEKVEVICSGSIKEADYIVFITKNGLVKKTAIEEYTNTKKKSGVLAVKIKEGDSLVNVSLAKENDNILLLSNEGRLLATKLTEFRATGRSTMGSKGIAIEKDKSEVIKGIVYDKNYFDYLGIFTKNGNGRKYKVNELMNQTKGGKGLVYGKKEQSIVDCVLFKKDDNLMITGSTHSLCISEKDVPLLISKTSVGNVIIKDSGIKLVSRVQN